MLPAQKILELISQNKLIVKGDYDFMVGSASLDVRLGSYINTYKMSEYTIGDHIDDSQFEQKKFSMYVLNPNESVIVSIDEKFHLPNHVAGLMIPRGSIIKLGISFPVNFINAGYKGTMSILLTNHSQMKIKLIPGVNIAQVVFFDLNEESHNPYSLNNKYYDEHSDKSKLEEDSNIDEIFKKAFPSLV